MCQTVSLMNVCQATKRCTGDLTSRISLFLFHVFCPSLRLIMHAVAMLESEVKSGQKEKQKQMSGSP